MKDFILPDIGEGIVECEIVEWRVREGDVIEEDQPVCDVMTDKALVEIPSIYAGKVAKLYYQKGEVAKVHAPLFSIDIISDSMQASSSENTQENHAQEDRTQEKLASKNREAKKVSSLEEFILPDVGEGIAECEVVEWLVNEGDTIEEDQPVCDIMTDKALVQIPAKHAGKIVKKHYQKGDIAKVHTPLFSMEVTGLAQSATEQTSQLDAFMPSEKALSSKGQDSKVSKSHLQHSHLQQRMVKKKAISSPSVRRLARELNIDLTQVPGSGEKGRIYKEDVLAFQKGEMQVQGSITPLQVATTTLPAVAGNGAVRTEPITGMMAAMARHMSQAVQTIPHFTFCEDIDLTDLIHLRSTLKERYQSQDIKLTMMPFFMKALSLALKAFPQINVQVNETCTELSYFDDHNIGVAVDSKLGLLVPNIKQCQSKSMRDIAVELTKLTADAREGRVSPDSLKGGTITISNIGALGGTVATPIINKPEAAIVALGRVQKLPRFNANGEVEARHIMQVSWSADHRIIDGATITRFNNQWKAYLENPATMLPELI